MNCVAKIAFDKGRNYITPEDVALALISNSEDDVRLAVLEIFGGNTGFGWEDFQRCAYLAYLGKIKPLNSEKSL